MQDPRLDKISCFESVDKELLKLLCIVSEVGASFSGTYLKEKISRILFREPIIIHPSCYETYLRLLDRLSDANGDQNE